MIFFIHILAGMPWVLLYLILPFDIVGFTSPCISDYCAIGILSTMLFYFPIYINLYIFSKTTINP